MCLYRLACVGNAVMHYWDSHFNPRHSFPQYQRVLAADSFNPSPSLDIVLSLRELTCPILYTLFLKVACTQWLSNVVSVLDFLSSIWDNSKGLFQPLISPWHFMRLLLFLYQSSFLPSVQSFVLHPITDVSETNKILKQISTAVFSLGDMT